MSTTKTLKPTPGPWLIGGDVVAWRIVDTTSLPIAFVAKQEMRQREIVNARYIAAVPLMVDFIEKRAAAGDDAARLILEHLSNANP